MRKFVTIFIMILVIVVTGSCDRNGNKSQISMTLSVPKNSNGSDIESNNISSTSKPISSQESNTSSDLSSNNIDISLFPLDSIYDENYEYMNRSIVKKYENYLYYLGDIEYTGNSDESTADPIFGSVIKLNLDTGIETVIYKGEDIQYFKILDSKLRVYEITSDFTPIYKIVDLDNTKKIETINVTDFLKTIAKKFNIEKELIGFGKLSSGYYFESYHISEEYPSFDLYIADEKLENLSLVDTDSMMIAEIDNEKIIYDKYNANDHGKFFKYDIESKKIDVIDINVPDLKYGDMNAFDNIVFFTRLNWSAVKKTTDESAKIYNKRIILLDYNNIYYSVEDIIDYPAFEIERSIYRETKDGNTLKLFTGKVDYLSLIDEYIYYYENVEGKIKLKRTKINGTYTEVVSE